MPHPIDKTIKRLMAFVVALCAPLAIGERLAEASSGEFFERKIRPLLLRQCIDCHGPEKQQGNLRLDNGDFIGDASATGTVVVRGRVDSSRLIEAVEYGDPALRMPPGGKLSDSEIADLKRWVAADAPWPGPHSGGSDELKPEAFDLDARRDAHWAWRPVRKPSIPSVSDESWPRDSLDKFILAKLEDHRMVPADPAERRVLLRRVYFDLIGLPPTPGQLQAFVADTSDDAYQKVVDHLLASPHFGERWARHWLDLARYAETYGHEDDHAMHYPWRYRDYVIRAFNDDLPYDQFIKEQIAGDLSPNPRLHPAEGYNESLIATGFHWLGESRPTPVNLSEARAERIENQIDVTFKTFQGLTVSCARCHDHKFDAISQEDYYAAFGVLRSSNYAQRVIDPPDLQQETLERVDRSRQRVQETVARAWSSQAEEAGAYLKAARGVVSGKYTGRWPYSINDKVLADFAKEGYEGWRMEGDAFAHGPVSLNYLSTILAAINVPGKVLTNGATSAMAYSHPVATPREENPAYADRFAAEGHELTGALTSRPFTIAHDYLHFQVAGGSDERTAVQLLVEGQIVRQATGRNEHRLRWESFDLRSLQGKTAVVRLIDRRSDDQYGYIGVGKLTLCDDSLAPMLRFSIGCSVSDVAKDQGLDPLRLADWVVAVADQQKRLTQKKVAERRKRKTSETQKTIVSSLVWKPDGPAFPAKMLPSGATVLGSNPEHPVAAILPEGWRHSGFRTGALNGTLRTSAFTLSKPYVHIRFMGDEARLALRVSDTTFDRPPLYGALSKLVVHHSGEPSWMTIHVPLWVDRQAYLEVIDHPERSEDDVFRFGRDFAKQGSVGVARIVLSDSEKLPRPTAAEDALAEQVVEQSVDKFTEILNHAISVWSTGASQSDSSIDSSGAGRLDSQGALLLHWVAQHDLLSPPDEYDGRQALAERLGQYHRLGSRITPARTTMAMVDGDSADVPVLIRGDLEQPGSIVPRRFLEAIAGDQQPRITGGSGRAELAQHLADPKNPLTARVMVNRIWRHLFGRGIVETVDNFGAMGQSPSHPELLDHLATRFVENGWSQKKIIRALTLSATYRMSGIAASPAYARDDPENRWFHRANVRRLEAETIRDAILAVSGQLDSRRYGAPHDEQRRSIYQPVRRNKLSSFYVAFDGPKPFTTIGRRDVSNVPTQALTMMNDSFVTQTANAWANSVMNQAPASKQDERNRITQVYRQAFSRDPDALEFERAVTFLERRRTFHRRRESSQGNSSQRESRQQESSDTQRDLRVLAWRDLCHALYNTKEFIFLR